MRVSGKLLSARLFLSAVLVVATVSVGFKAETAQAAQITSRNLVLQAQGNDGGSKPSGVVSHLFNFTTATTASVGSIQFTYCTTASGTCTPPQGLSTTSATLGSESGATGFTNVQHPSANVLYIARSSASNINASVPVSYQLQSVTNPQNANETFFVRIATYGSLDTTGSPIDTGTVTASTATAIQLSGTMPESLIFCTGEDIPLASGIPNCSAATPGAITFNQLFSPTDTATAKSQMAASTNATTGFNISVNGATMTSGSNTISGMSSATAGARGTAQFGMNLKANTVATSTPAVGTEVTPAADGADYRGQPAVGYDVADVFKFVSGNTVANSENGTPGTGNPTNSQIYTVSYIVNVPGNQAAGTYATTLTYVCTATF
jgi:hypothetical protein